MITFSEGKYKGLLLVAYEKGMRKVNEERLNEWINDQLRYERERRKKQCSTTPSKASTRKEKRLQAVAAQINIISTTNSQK